MIRSARSFFRHPFSRANLLALPLLWTTFFGSLLIPAWAQDEISLSSCSGQTPSPVNFQIDCSHVKDAAAKQLCRPFIENQACRVFPAYRKITGINLENDCKSIKFTIYDDDNWPHPKAEGGLALNCAVDYLAKYSLQGHPNSKIGPYDVHELLHEYHIPLGALPSEHVLFSSSMAEAMPEIGATDDYERAMANMKNEAPRLEQELREGKITGDSSAPSRSHRLRRPSTWQTAAASMLSIAKWG